MRAKPTTIVHAPKPKRKAPPTKAAAIVEAKSPQQIARAKRHENRWLQTLMESTE
jgi:hypothetical protein